MTGDVTAQPTRLCAECSERKTIRGVWYLVNARDSSSPEFLCETCFTFSPAPVNRPETPGAPLAHEVPLHGQGTAGSPSHY